MSDSAEVLLLVRLQTQQPDGTTLGERERTSHLVPFSLSEAIPAFLTAYCGLKIVPGTAEWLDGVLGMPCEACLARSPIPAFTMLRGSRRQGESLSDVPAQQLAAWGLSR